MGDFFATVFGALLLIVFGLIVTFYGYGIFRLLLPIMGFVAGMMLGRALFPEAVFWGWVFGIVLALLFAFLAYAYWSVMMAISGGVLGFTLGVSLIQMIGFWDWIGVVVGIVLAVIFGALYFMFRDIFVMVSTGLAGAALVLYGLGYGSTALLGWFQFLQNQGNWITFILTLVLGTIGALVQLMIFSGMRYYSETARTAPPVIIVPGQPATSM